MKKKILHIVEAFGGGIFSFLVDLINNTSDEYEIVVAYAMREQTPENFEEKFSSNIRFIRVQNFVRSISIKKDIQAFMEIKKIIKEEKPQIIHLHSSKAGFLGRMASIGYKAKIIYNPHGFSFLMQNCSLYKKTLYRILEKIGTLKDSIIIGCSNGEFKEALKLSKHAICINNGVSVEEIDRIIDGKFSNFELDFENVKFCTSGRICYQKNPRLFNEIALKFPNNKFIWVGDGEDKNDLTSPNICITGWKNKEQVIKSVNECEIFVLTSMWEGLPISLLEAMALKKLCIVSNCIGNRDVINNNINGYIINDITDFPTIEEMKSSYLKLIENARKDVESKYSVKGMIENYKKIYEDG